MIDQILASQRVVGGYTAPVLPRVGLRTPEDRLGEGTIGRVLAVALAVHADANREQDVVHLAGPVPLQVRVVGAEGRQAGRPRSFT